MKKFFYNQFMKSISTRGFENRQTIIYGKIFELCK